MHGGRQQISLGSGCYSQGTIIHEFIHAIGFDHEQSRPDRDNYVKIMWGNIRGGRKNDNFWKANGWKMFDTEYDWRSVMHYRAYNGASINGGPTITSIVSKDWPDKKVTIYSPIFYLVFSKKFRKYLILLPAFYLIIWLMKSSKSFEKIAILKI